MVYVPFPFGSYLKGKYTTISMNSITSSVLYLFWNGSITLGDTFLLFSYRDISCRGGTFSGRVWECVCVVYVCRRGYRMCLG